jgi:nitroreductase
MDFIQLATERYSVRKFARQIVENEKIDLILKAGQVSPTACNYQPQRILVIKSESAMSQLKECTSYHFDAPLAFLICYDKTVSWKRSFDNDDSGDVDASIVTTHMMLEAAALGLGTTWVGYFDPDKIRKAYNIPENYVPVALLPTGYPADDASPYPAHDKRHPLEQTVFYDCF